MDVLCRSGVIEKMQQSWHFSEQQHGVFYVAGRHSLIVPLRLVYLGLYLQGFVPGQVAFVPPWKTERTRYCEGTEGCGAPGEALWGCH